MQSLHGDRGGGVFSTEWQESLQSHEKMLTMLLRWSEESGYRLSTLGPGRGDHARGETVKDTPPEGTWDCPWRGFG